MVMYQNNGSVEGSLQPECEGVVVMCVRKSGIGKENEVIEWKSEWVC